MKEKGVVVSLKGHMVAVSVQRKAVPRDCCNFDNDTFQSVLIEAENQCGANIGDKVYIDSDEDKRIRRTFMQIGIGFFVFISGMLFGDYLAGNLLVMTTGRELVSFSSGIALALVAYFIGKYVNKKNKISMPIANEIINNS